MFGILVSFLVLNAIVCRGTSIYLKNPLKGTNTPALRCRTWFFRSPARFQNNRRGLNRRYHRHELRADFHKTKAIKIRVLPFSLSCKDFLIQRLHSDRVAGAAVVVLECSLWTLLNFRFVSTGALCIQTRAQSRLLEHRYVRGTSRHEAMHDRDPKRLRELIDPNLSFPGKSPTLTICDAGAFEPQNVHILELGREQILK